MLNFFEQKNKLYKSSNLLPDSPLSSGSISLPKTCSKTAINSSISYNSEKNIPMNSITSNQINFDIAQTKQSLMNSKMYHQNNFSNISNNDLTNEGTNYRQKLSSLDSPLSSQSTSSCEIGIEQNSPSPCSQACNNIKYNTATECETNSISTIDQQVITYSNNGISAYSINKINIEDISIDDFSLNKVIETENINFDNQNSKKILNDNNFKKFDSNETLNNFDLNKNNLVNNKDFSNNFVNFDYTDTNFFCSVWNNSESLDNLNYNNNLDNDYLDNFSSNCSSLEKNLYQNNSQAKTSISFLNNVTNEIKKSYNQKVENCFKDEKKSLNCPTNEEFYEIASFNSNIPHNTDFFNDPHINSCSIKENNIEEDDNKKSWLYKSIFDWNYEELSEFFHSLSQEKNIPIEELRAFFLDYNSIQLANMSKEQMFFLNSKHGPLIYQAINQLKTNLNNSYVENYFNQQSTNFNTESSESINSTQKTQNHQEVLASSIMHNENFSLMINDSNTSNNQNNHYTNLPSFDLLKNPCYDLSCTDQSPSSSSDSDRDSISSSMTSVNEHRKTISQNENLVRQPVLFNENDFFCLPNTILNRNTSNFDNLNQNMILAQNHNPQVQNNQNLDISDQEQIFHNFDLQSNILSMNENINFQSNFVQLNSNLNTHENCNKKNNQNNNSFNQDNINSLANDFESNFFRNTDNKQSQTNEDFLIDPETHQNLNSNNDNLVNQSDSHQLEELFTKNKTQMQQNESNTNVYLTSTRSLNNLEKNKTLNTTLESLVKNCNLDDSHFLEEHSHLNFHSRHFHPSNPLNNSKNLNINLDQSLNISSINKINITGRRGRPPKKDSKPRGRQSRGKGNGKLWEFIRDLLLDPVTNPSFIRWERREDGVFKFVQSDKVAKLWGQRKQNPRMTYEKLSRAMRYYYKSQVLMPVFGRRLVYKFGPNATGWRPNQSMY